MNPQEMMDWESADELSSSLRIQQLYDDCLEKSFQYLSVADQIEETKAYIRFQTTYRDFFDPKNKFVSNEITKDMTLMQTRHFFQLCSHQFQSLLFNGFKDDFFKHCFYSGFNFPSLKNLVVMDNQLKVPQLELILLGTIKLEELTVITPPKTDRLDLAHLTKLKKLEITDWNTKALRLPTSIEVLILQDWNKFSCLPSILEDHTQIKKLRILNCQSNVFKEMAKSQAFASVEVLDLMRGNSYGKEPFTQLPNLKKLRLGFLQELPNLNELKYHQIDHLNINGQRCLKKKVMLQITELIGLRTLFLCNSTEIDNEVIKKFGNLKELRRLVLINSNITERSVLQLLINCPKLNTLRMPVGQNVTDSLVHSITSLVQEAKHCGKNQRELPIKLQLPRSTEIKSTTPDVVVVDSNDYYDWFEEELQVNI